MIVIGIIAVLISILFPALNVARLSAQKVKCQNNLKQWGAAMQMYENDNKSYLPLDGEGDGNAVSDAWGVWNDPTLWVNALPPYLGLPMYYQLQDGGQHIPIAGDNSIFICPSVDANVPGPSDQPNSPDGYAMMFGDTEENPLGGTPTVDATPRKVFLCYVMNSNLNDSIPAANQGYVNAAQIPQPASEVAFMVEKSMNHLEAAKWNAPTSINRGKTGYSRFAARHSGGGNILFLDGHVAWFSYNDLMNHPPNLPDYNYPGEVIWNPFGAGSS